MILARTKRLSVFSQDMTIRTKLLLELAYIILETAVKRRNHILLRKDLENNRFKIEKRAKLNLELIELVSEQSERSEQQ
jgi:hypothetical protein